MGKTLLVRVSAATHDPDDVFRRWPELSRLAWGEKQNADLKDVGVRQLTDVLEDKWKFGEDWPRDLKNFLARDVVALGEMDRRLEDALADRRADVADRITYELEDALDELEGLIKKQAFVTP
ncbi:hypothetical protein [Desulfonatronum sp. SC1]|uniref:hypothetical protein n=1 Tax=Desulfonatronum sp. SC1 TaxID=2109626 RepID=UPI000D31594C|nr:hypothetical protein [Desulfonatronum sp. SC1]PTN33457.1 hypothetical protein C6366_14375 [Desulfonatronum sp. SC1]